MRHPSLQTGLSNMYSNSHACNVHNKRDIHVQKIYVNIVFSPIFSTFQGQPFILFFN